MFKKIKYILNQKRIEKIENLFNNIFEEESNVSNKYQAIRVGQLREKLFWEGIKEEDFMVKKELMHFINACILKLHKENSKKHEKRLLTLIINLKLELIS